MVFKYFMYLLFIAMILSFYVWQQTQSVRMGYRVEEMKRECGKWEQENSTLKLKIERLSSLERLDQFSREHKLVVPDEKNIVYLD
ncbi:MAG: hypothetical protein ABII64_09395 [Elusimicrobiota bacterium]